MCEAVQGCVIQQWAQELHCVKWIAVTLGKCDGCLLLANSCQTRERDSRQSPASKLSLLVQ
jgi:hypothetical protein